MKCLQIVLIILSISSPDSLASNKINQFVKQGTIESKALLTIASEIKNRGAVSVGDLEKIKMTTVKYKKSLSPIIRRTSGFFPDDMIISNVEYMELAQSDMAECGEVRRSYKKLKELDKEIISISTEIEEFVNNDELDDEFDQLIERLNQLVYEMPQVYPDKYDQIDRGAVFKWDLSTPPRCRGDFARCRNIPVLSRLPSYYYYENIQIEKFYVGDKLIREFESEEEVHLPIYYDHFIQSYAVRDENLVVWKNISATEACLDLFYFQISGSYSVVKGIKPPHIIEEDPHCLPREGGNPEVGCQPYPRKLDGKYTLLGTSGKL